MNGTWLAWTAAAILAVATAGCATSNPAQADPEAVRAARLAAIHAMPITRPATDYTWEADAIARGPRDEKVIALMFTGGEWGQGTDFILDELARRGIKGAFYFTGDYLNTPEFRPGLTRMIAEGHLVGPHGHAHLLYAPWDDRSRTLVTRDEFVADLRRNIEDVVALGIPREQVIWWVAPYEWYNEQIVQWSLEEGMRLHNFTRGTLSSADYTTADAANYRDSETIFRSLVDYEAREPDGLNGFLLFTHVGASPQRPDPFHYRLPALLDHLHARGYSFVRVDELLEGAPLRSAR
jgi:peptidoglycan/xylan/chitin deacetylase (PgdA/CDA1 family)